MKTEKDVNIDTEVFALNTASFLPADEYLHWYKNDEGTKVICITDSRGYEQPDNKSILEIIVDASDGFIPLWDRGVTLNWRFNKSFGSYFENPSAAKDGIMKIMMPGILK